MLGKFQLKGTLLRRGSPFNAEHGAANQQHARPSAKREWPVLSEESGLKVLLCFHTDILPSRLRREDLRGSVSSEKSRYFDLEFFRNIP